MIRLSALFLQSCWDFRGRDVRGAAASATFRAAREWTPQAIEALRQKAPSKTEFNLDHSMLILASKLDPTTRIFAA